jgi:hypothetical protein
MKKTFFALMATAMIVLLASLSYAGGNPFQLVGRELFKGIQYGDVYYGALFMGKILDQTYSKEVGDFSVTLNRVDEGVEQCGGETRILQFKLVMHFDNGNRLVLVLNDDNAVAAWDYDDPFCSGECIFRGYLAYIDLLLEDTDNPFGFCSGEGALIAKVESEGDPISLRKRRLGSSLRGLARKTTRAKLNGWLVHTPLVVPAVFGTVVLY